MPATTVTSETAAEFYAGLRPSSEVTDAVIVDDKTAAGAKPDADGATKPKKPIQPRINELVAEREEARALALAEGQKASELERELADLKSKLEALQTAPDPVETTRPVRDKFATQEEFDDAMIDWRADQRIAERERKAIEARQQTVQSQIVQNWQARQEEFRKTTEDYDEVLGGADMQFPQFMLDALIECDPGVAYHLAKNPDVGERLLKLTPTAALRELGKLEDKLAAGASAPAPAPAPAAAVRVETSKAPPPIETLKGGSSVVQKDPKDMTYQEFRKWREAQTTN